MANIAAVETITGRFHPNPELSSTLPAHYYYDPRIFEREKQEIWFKTWQFAGFGQDLREPGDYLTNEIIDQKILVVRAKDGRLRAFYNVCMHRGTSSLKAMVTSRSSPARFTPGHMTRPVS